MEQVSASTSRICPDLDYLGTRGLKSVSVSKACPCLDSLDIMGL